MAQGARPTLKLKRPEPVVEAPKDIPVYDPEKACAHVGGVGMVQGKNVFDPGSKRFLREAPKEAWYFLTPEQEQNYKRQMAKQRQLFSRNLPQTAPPAVPNKVIQIAKENAQAAAAEALAE